MYVVCIVFTYFFIQKFNRIPKQKGTLFKQKLKKKKNIESLNTKLSKTTKFLEEILLKLSNLSFHFYLSMRKNLFS